ncbi:putative phage abortive infection protein [Pedobacter heparinus]|uniref:putative phage abortive infection protein n=1 Tax=Pedobacter heparinus TaxID=984 RepID=UPI00292CE1BF|nr:putative phage abortive infection protein [Pedobacter heparinus]
MSNELETANSKKLPSEDIIPKRTKKNRNFFNKCSLIFAWTFGKYRIDKIKLYQTVSLWITGILTVCISLFFVFWSMSNLYLNKGVDIEWDTTGQVGDFFGGVVGTLVAAFGSILIYMSFRSQSKAQQKQHEQFETTLERQEKTDRQQRLEFMKAQIENRFIVLVELHQKNLASVFCNHYTPALKERDAIAFIVSQVESCFKEIKPFFDNVKVNEIYTAGYLINCKKIKERRTKLDLIEMARLDIAYCFVFYGVSIASLYSILPQFVKAYKIKFISLIFYYLYLKLPEEKNIKLWKELTHRRDVKTISEIAEDIHLRKPKPRHVIKGEDYDIINALLKERTYPRFYNGHHDAIGHYFRHLYQAVKYIDKQNILVYEEKYDYIKTLRAQLSNNEQYLLFYNSISFMGREWEFEHLTVDSKEPNWDLCFFTKYNFIKNIPNISHVNGTIDITYYYPDVHFEFESESRGRKDLIEKFS